MSTAAVAADALGPRRSNTPEPSLRLVPAPADRASRQAPTDRASRPAPADRASRQAPADRTSRPAPAERTTASTPVVAPRKRPRIDGVTTDRMPVRGCSGDSLGRRVQEHPEPALRLTRRGRMLLTAISVLVFGAAVLVLGLRIAGVLEPGPHFTHTVPVQVAPGQTLWSIAESTNPGQDPTIVVEKIADLNKLATPADITPGQTLQIPIAG